jgi:hypothetical protein
MFPISLRRYQRGNEIAVAVDYVCARPFGGMSDPRPGLYIETSGENQSAIVSIEGQIGHWADAFVRPNAHKPEIVERFAALGWTPVPLLTPHERVRAEAVRAMDAVVKRSPLRTWARDCAGCAHHPKGLRKGAVFDAEWEAVKSTVDYAVRSAVVASDMAAGSIVYVDPFPEEPIDWKVGLRITFRASIRMHDGTEVTIDPHVVTVRER